MRINRYYLKKIEHWLLPFTCILCHSLTDTFRDLCFTCEQSLPKLPKHCPQCAHPLPKPWETTHCAACQQNPPVFAITHALYAYQTPIIQLIRELKFKHTLVNARILGELLALHLQNIYHNKPLPEIIIPLPLHLERLKQRGFNQALELARPVAKTLKRPLHYALALRTKSTQPQATLNAIERRYNMQDAFQITSPLDQKSVAVIDDVITTGETIKAFCQALKQAGAGQIDVWCIARAHHTDD